jgi:hypothetical protein
LEDIMPTPQPAAPSPHRDPEAHAKLEALDLAVKATGKDVAEIKRAIAGDLKTGTPGLAELLRNLIESKEETERRLARHSDRIRNLEARQQADLEAELAAAKAELAARDSSRTWATRLLGDKTAGVLFALITAGILWLMSLLGRLQAYQPPAPPAQHQPR